MVEDWHAVNPIANVPTEERMVMVLRRCSHMHREEKRYQSKNFIHIGMANGGEMVRMVSCGDYRDHRSSFWPPGIAHHADKDGTHQDTVIGLCITPHLEHKHKLGCLHKSTCKTGQPGSMTDSPCYLYP